MRMILLATLLALPALSLCTVEVLDMAESVRDMRCIAAEGFTQLVFRGLMSSGLPDPTARANLEKAIDVDCTVYLVPCFKCGNAAKQIADTCDAIYGTNYFYHPYLVVEDPAMWSADMMENRAFVEEAVRAILGSGRKCFDNVRFRSTKYEWEKILGLDYSSFSDRVLWYVSDDKRKSHRDFRPFGGWNVPRVKQYNKGQEICGNQVNFDVQDSPFLPRSGFVLKSKSHSGSE